MTWNKTTKVIKEPIYNRKGKILINLETGKKINYKFINEAKRASRKLQKEHGFGSVRVI